MLIARVKGGPIERLRSPQPDETEPLRGHCCDMRIDQEFTQLAGDVASFAKLFGLPGEDLVKGRRLRIEVRIFEQADDKPVGSI